MSRNLCVIHICTRKTWNEALSFQLWFKIAIDFELRFGIAGIVCCKQRMLDNGHAFFSLKGKAWNYLAVLLKSEICFYQINSSKLNRVTENRKLKTIETHLKFLCRCDSTLMVNLLSFLLFFLHFLYIHVSIWPHNCLILVRDHFWLSSKKNWLAQRRWRYVTIGQLKTGWQTFRKLLVKTGSF